MFGIGEDLKGEVPHDQGHFVVDPIGRARPRTCDRLFPQFRRLVILNICSLRNAFECALVCPSC